MAFQELNIMKRSGPRAVFAPHPLHLIWLCVCARVLTHLRMASDCVSVFRFSVHLVIKIAFPHFKPDNVCLTLRKVCVLQCVFLLSSVCAWVVSVHVHWRIVCVGGGTCSDKLTNCNSYGQNVCTDTQYDAWARDNCAHFCNKCCK